MASIYGLYDRNGKLRYIGKANNPTKRLASHMRDSRRRDTPLYRWIRKNGVPEMRVLECDCADWVEAERRIIAAARENGENLLNVADGGDQPKCDAETRSRLGHALVKKLQDDPLMRRKRDIKRQLIAAIEDGFLSNARRKSLRVAAVTARNGDNFLSCFALIPDRPEDDDGNCLWEIGRAPSGRYGYVQPAQD